MGKRHSREVVREYVHDPSLVQQLQEFQKQNAYLLQEYEKLRQNMAAREINSFEDLQRHDQRGAEALIHLASQTVPLQLGGGRSFGFFGLTSTGKSTMINKLIGSDLAKTGAGETTTQITHYDGSGYRLYDIPGRNDDISYFSMEYVAFWKALTARLVLITSTVKEMTKVFRLLDAINLRYDIVVNKFDLVPSNERDVFKQQIQNQIRECGLRGVDHVWYISAQNPRQFRDWMIMVDSLTIQFKENRSITYGEGYHLFTPSPAKREEMLMSAEKTERQYEEYIKRRGCSNLNEVNPLGGRLEINDVRKRQFEEYKNKTVTSQEKSRLYKLQQKQKEEQEIEAKKHAARSQGLLLEQKNQMMTPALGVFLSPWQQEATNWIDNTREQNPRAETIEHQFIADTLSSDQAVEDFAIVCEHLFAIDSWTEEQKSSVFQLISEWESKFKQSLPSKFKTNMHYLSKIFTDPNGIAMNLPADTILKLIQSTDIPAECWFDCLLATLLETNGRI